MFQSSTSVLPLVGTSSSWELYDRYTRRSGNRVRWTRTIDLELIRFARSTYCATTRKMKEKNTLIFFTTGRIALRIFPLQHNYYNIIFILCQIFKRYKFIFFQILYKFHNIKWLYFLPFFNPRFNARNSYFRKERE